MKAAGINPVFAALALVVTVAVVLLASRAQPFEKVDAGGHWLRVLATGEGGPTVILENGLGPTLEVWGRVQPQLSGIATTISYDRAGVGRSQAGPLPRDARQIALELHTVLQNMGASPPYVMAGYSFGGLYVRTFTDMYPDEVAALVLVDPTRHDEFDVDTFEGSQYPELDAAPATMRQAEQGTIPAHVPVYLILAMGAGERPYGEAATDEYTSGRLDDMKAHTQWLEGLAEGRLIVTRHSGHGVPYEEPALIIDTIREAVSRVRQ